MHSRGNWDDFRYVLAVAEAGSVSQAARVMGVNHATVLRHVAAFEETFGSAVFEKNARGYRIRDDKLRVVDALREVATAVQGVDSAVAGTQTPLRGVVRVTSTDTFCHVVLPPILARLHAGATQLRIDLMSTNAHLDLSRLQSDITVRPTQKLDEDLSGDIAAKLGFDVYAQRGSATTDWLALTGPVARSRVAAWMGENVSPDRIVGAGDSFVSLRELAAFGVGQTILPCILGDTDPRLERRRCIMPEMSVDIWVASHSELADVARVRAVRKLLVEELARQADALLGVDPAGP